MTKRSRFGWLEFILGVLFIALGILTLVYPGGALTGVVVVYSIVAIITGITDIVFYVKVHSSVGFGPSISLVSGILSALAGLLLLFNPPLGRWIFSVLFSVWFIAHSISRLANQQFIRQVAGKAVSVVSIILNVLCIIVGVLMLVYPAVTALSLGYLVAIGLMVHGVNSVIEAFSGIGRHQPAGREVQ